MNYTIKFTFCNIIKSEGINATQIRVAKDPIGQLLHTKLFSGIDANYVNWWLHVLF